MAFGELYGLLTCHSYGNDRMRVSFPVRQMLRLLSQSIARNIERLSYAKRLQTRKLVRQFSQCLISQNLNAIIDQHAGFVRFSAKRIHRFQPG